MVFQCPEAVKAEKVVCSPSYFLRTPLEMVTLKVYCWEGVERGVRIRL